MNLGLSARVWVKAHASSRLLQQPFDRTFFFLMSLVMNWALSLGFLTKENEVEILTLGQGRLQVSTPLN